jgi:SPP1 gp7 family putative phage head morphogenesis protein
MDLAQPVAEAFENWLISVLPKIESIKSVPETLIAALEEAIYRTIMISWLLGRFHVQESAPKNLNFKDDLPEEVELPHKEAIEYLQSRTSMSRDAFYDLDAAGRFRAFTVAKVSGMEAIEETKKKLLAALSEGLTMTEFIQSGRASEIIQKGGFSKSTPWYWETVFRTNAVAAWNGGRFQQYREVADSIDMLQYIAILDRRTSDVCRSYDGITRPVSDSIWQTITPPNHFNCRSTVTAIWKGTLEAKRTRPTSDEDVAVLPRPDDGFDSSIVDQQDFLMISEKLQQKIFKYGLDDDIERKRKEALEPHSVYVGQGQYVNFPDSQK